MKTKMPLIHKILAAYVGLGTFLQMFLAGIWHAGVVSTPEFHVFFGLSMLLAALLALIAAAVGKMSRPVIIQTAVLFVLILLQPFLIETRGSSIPFVSAFHTLNAAFIGMMSGKVMALTSSTVEQEDPVAVASVAGD